LAAYLSLDMLYFLRYRLVLASASGSTVQNDNCACWASAYVQSFNFRPIALPETRGLKFFTSDIAVTLTLTPRPSKQDGNQPPTMSYLQARFQLGNICTLWDIALKSVIYNPHPPTYPSTQLAQLDSREPQENYCPFTKACTFSSFCVLFYSFFAVSVFFIFFISVFHFLWIKFNIDWTSVTFNYYYFLQSVLSAVSAWLYLLSLIYCTIYIICLQTKWW